MENTQLVALHERMNAWMLSNDPSHLLPVVGWGVVPDRDAVVVGLRHRDEALEQRLRVELGGPLVFEVQNGEYRPL